MNLTFQSQCYLAAWDAEMPLSGGLAHGARLWDFKLDYSWNSLARIDAFLDELRARETPEIYGFLAERPNVNLLLLLAFYAGEVRARRCGVASKWMSWEQLLEADPSHKVFGAGFHSSVVQVQPSIFLPLVSILQRLFEGAHEKSLAFSSAIATEHFPDLSGGDGARILAPLAPVSLVPSAADAFLKLRAMRRARYRAARWPAWFRGDPLERWRRDIPVLLERGQVVWASVVQANKGLFDGSVAGAPLEVLYDPRGLVDRENLTAIAQALLALKGTRADDPALQHYADHLESETTRLFNWSPPPTWLPYPLTASTTYIDSGWLPGRRLAFSQFPILVSDECPGHVMILPRELWPAPLLAQWGEGVSDVAPLPVVVTPSAQDAQDGERLYREGLAFWHAAPPDHGAAIAKWREAGKLHHYLALCALSAALIEMGGSAAPSAAAEQGAAAAFASFAIAEYRLGFVEAAKLHLRPDRPDPRKGDQQARDLLQLAASLGDRHALHMLKVMTRMAE